MEPWNDPTILPPPVSTFLYSGKYDIEDLSRACNNAINVLLKQSPLYKESAILSRFIYKYDMKFRNDIGYRILKKINVALRRYLSLNLLKAFQNFIAIMPSKKEEKYLPTKQMLEYIMIRIMSLSQLMKRICVCSKQASIYYMNRIKRGESHWMSLMPYALLSRIWTMSTVLLQHTCSWYNSLFPYLEQLQHKGLQFLPIGYTLPTNLKDWLDIKNLDDHGRFEWSLRKGIQINIHLAEDEEISLDCILDYVKDVNSDHNEKQQVALTEQNKSVQAPAIKDIDQGVSITREYFQSFFNKQIVQDTHSSKNVVSKVTLDQFISREEHYRNETSELSLTNHLSFMQWHTLKTSLVNLAETLSNSRKIERKFKKIWKEKCLDYL